MKKMLACLVLCAVALVFADNPHTPRAPITVAEQDFINQTGSVAPTTIFTPAANGTFRISCYAEASTAPQPAGSDTTLFSWTDDFNTQSNATGFALFVGPGNPGFATFTTTIHALAGTPISLATTSTTTGVYSLYVLVEQL